VRSIKAYLRPSFASFVCSVSILGAFVAVGCATTGSGDGQDVLRPEEEGGIDAGSQDATTDDAPVDDAGDPCSPDGFCRTRIPGQPLPILTGVFSASPTRAVAISADGRVFLWNGTDWKSLAIGYGLLAAVWANDADHFWFVESASSTYNLYRLTFQGAQVNIVREPPLAQYGNCFGKNLSLSGTPEGDIYIAGYCAKFNEFWQTTMTTFLLHRQSAAGNEGEPLWSPVWTYESPSDRKFVLGGVHAVSRDEVFAVGWETPGAYTPVDTFIAPGFLAPEGPGTSASVLHVKNGVIEKEDLDPSLGMCARSVWSAGGEGDIFVGGACDSYPTDLGRQVFPVIARRGRLDDGSVGWAPLLRERADRLTLAPARLWGFDDANVYGVGKYAIHWDGKRLEFAELAIDGSPLLSVVRAAHGSSKTDFWMVGDGFALHRGQ
jgi:hypothetical protein